MNCDTSILVGPARAGKTSRLLAAYRTALAAGPPGNALWIGPNHAAVESIRNALIDGQLSQCLRPNCLTFGKLSQTILEASASPLRPVDELMKRSLLADILQRGISANQIRYFAPLAGSPGLIRLVAAVIRQWKRLEIWPYEFAEACTKSGLSQKDAELLWMYEEYQRVLTEHQLYDLEGRLWLARTQLREGTFRPFEEVRHVFVDGFTDFTRTELETLSLIAGRVESMQITLPGEAASVGNARGDLFAKPSATVLELQRRLPKATVQQLDWRASEFPALDQIEVNLFRPLGTFGLAKHGGVTVLAAAGRRQEFESLARRIKTLLTRRDQPAHPEQILVVLRSLSENAAMLGEVLERFGIPAALEEAPALGHCACVSSLIAWLKLAVEDWPFRQLLAILSHNSLQPDWPQWQQGRASIAAEHLVRELQAPRGRSSVLSQIQHWASEATDARRGWHHEQRLKRAQLAAPLLTQIARATDSLPDNATPRQWTVALAALANDVGINKLTAQSDVESAAWDRLMAHLGSIDRLQQWTSRPTQQAKPQRAPVQLDRRELLDLICDIASSEAAPTNRNATGCVRVVRATTARSVSAPYVFVAGLTEKSFPSFAGESSLYGDAEIAQLAAAGLPLPTQIDRSHDEMLLFYEVVTRATRELVLSYPSMDDKAQPLPPSPYLSEFLRAFQHGGVEFLQENALSPVPQNQPIFCEQDWRLRAVYDALAKDHKLLAGMFQAGTRLPTTQAANLRSALMMLQSRTRQAFGPFEGLLGSDATLNLLSSRFGEDRCWSASQLERYAYCPFQYFLSRVLKIEPLADLSLETDHMLRGSLIHGALSNLHRQLNQTAGSQVSPTTQSAEAFEKQALEVLATLMESLATSDPLASALREVDRRVLSQWLMNYYEQHQHYDDACMASGVPFRPAHFEVEFGPEYAAVDDEAGLHVESDKLRTSQPLELKVADQTIRISGRIDRVDLGQIAGQAVFHVIDYKSSTKVDFKPEMIASGERLQLPLYALALEQLLLADRGAIPWRASYWLVKEKGVRHRAMLDFHELVDGQIQPTEAWQAVREQLLEIVARLVKGIRGGQFPVYCADDACTSRCEFHTVCRIGQIRSLEKVWQIGGLPEVSS